MFLKSQSKFIAIDYFKKLESLKVGSGFDLKGGYLKKFFVTYCFSIFKGAFMNKYVIKISRVYEYIRVHFTIFCFYTFIYLSK